MKHAVQVTIFGQQYTVRSEASPEEVRQVAAFVNERMAEVAAAGTVDTLNVAVLALMNIGGAYLRLQDRTRQDERGAERLRCLLTRLEGAMPEPSAPPAGI